MNQEIEVKILEVDENKIKEKLEKANAVKGKFVHQKDSFYKNKDSNHKVIRVRDEGEDVFITVKGPVNYDEGHKIREELEFNVKDEKKIKRMLELLGFEEYQKRETKRQYYKLNNCSVELIYLSKVPMHLEIEGTKEDIAKTLELLSYTPDDVFKGVFDKHYGYDNVYNQIFEE